ncbi:MAG: hypothetical protein EHM30_12345, partial [Desulfobacteraceae bacterium]
MENQAILKIIQNLFLRLSVAAILISGSGIAAICSYPLPVSSQEIPSSMPAAGHSPPAATGQPPVTKGLSPDVALQSDKHLSDLSAQEPRVEQALSQQKESQEQTLQANAYQQKTVISGGQVFLNFDDADVYSVIQTIFGDVLKVNYIIDPKVKGRVTFRSVKPVANEKVLPLMEVILRLNGVAVVEESGLYRIIPIGDISKEPAPVKLGRDPEIISLTGTALLQVVPVRYMQSSDVVKLLAPFLSLNAVVVDVPLSNQIIIVDTDANVKRLLQLVEIFDNEQHKKKGPRVFVYPVQNGKAKDIASQLQQIFLGGKTFTEKKAAVVTVPQSQPISAQAQQISKPSPDGETLVSGITRIFSDETLNVVIVLATPEDYEIIKDAIAKIDLVPRQVMIEGMIAQIGLTDNLSLGLAWSINAGKLGNIFGTNGFGVDTNISFNAASLDPAKISGTGLNLIGTDSGNSVRAIISALASQSKAKLLAAPHILVSDNREASIQVGQQVPIATS